MIYHLLSILVFFIAVAALIMFILFLCVLIDMITVWWEDRKTWPSMDPTEIPNWPCYQPYSHASHFWSDGTTGFECPGVK